MNNEWISVKDRLPVQEGKYLVCSETPCFTTIKTAYFSLNLNEFDPYDFPDKHRPGWNNYDSESGFYEETNITYWMPLPAAPERIEEE